MKFLQSKPYHQIVKTDAHKHNFLSRGGNWFTIADVDTEESGKIWNWFSRN
ncbi:hypothetical protein [Methanohalophilus sp.]